MELYLLKLRNCMQWIIILHEVDVSRALLESDPLWSDSSPTTSRKRTVSRRISGDRLREVQLYLMWFIPHSYIVSQYPQMGKIRQVERKRINEAYIHGMFVKHVTHYFFVILNVILALFGNGFLAHK